MNTSTYIDVSVDLLCCHLV